METMRDRFVEVASSLVDEQPDVAVVLADIGVGRFAETGALQRHPDRIINVGIREQAMIGVAAGMAHTGLRPIAHSYTPFLVERPFEQIKLDFAHQGLGAILVSIGGSYDAATEGRTHQAPGDIALLATLPTWTLHAPGHADEVELFLRQAVRHDRPVYIRLADAQNEHAVAQADGRLVTVRSGTSTAPTIVAVGPMLRPTLDAVTGFDATVLYTATVRPFDRVGLARAFGRNPEVVLIEPTLAGTTSSEVSAALSHVPHRLLALGVGHEEVRHYGTRHDHDRFHGLDAPGLRSSIAGFIGWSPDRSAA